MKNWDYGVNAIYFVTICTQRHGCFFGDVVDGQMVFSDIGKTAHSLWVDIPKQFPFVILDEFIVMPNHVHGLIVIDKEDDEAVGNGDAMSLDAINRVSTGGGGVTGNSNPMLH